MVHQGGPAPVLVADVMAASRRLTELARRDQGASCTWVCYAHILSRLGSPPFVRYAFERARRRGKPMGPSVGPNHAHGGHSADGRRKKEGSLDGLGGGPCWGLLGSIFDPQSHVQAEQEAE